MTHEHRLQVEPGIRLHVVIDDFNQIKCRTLIMTTTGSHLRPLNGVKAWQKKMPNSKLMVIEGDAWHPAGAYSDVCGPAAARFLLSTTK